MPKKPLLIACLLVVATLAADASAKTARAHSTSFSATANDLIYDVPAIEQTKTMDCWAAAAAMLVSWQTKTEISEISVVTMAGGQYVSAFQSDAGLFPQNVADFASQLHLAAETPQSFDERGYRDLLTRFGPLWVGATLTGTQGLYKHVRVVTGIDGSGKLHIIDPDGPRIYTEGVSDFENEVETFTGADLGAGADKTPQILHLPPQQP